MDLHIPRHIRAALYIFTAFGSLIVTYLGAATEYIGAPEMALWTGFTALIASMAGFNLTPPDQEP